MKNLLEILGIRKKAKEAPVKGVTLIHISDKNNYFNTLALEEARFAREKGYGISEIPAEDLEKIRQGVIKRLGVEYVYDPTHFSFS